jgi:hypothetical protein
MSIEIRMPKSFKKRIANLPKMMTNLVQAKTKKDATTLVKIFHDGIKNNSLGLQKLSALTISAKGQLSMPSPHSPLYGKGDQEQERSYMNMMRIKVNKGSYTVQPSIAMHWSKKLKLKTLFMIHEYGAIASHGQGENARMVRIPPRPAFLKAYKLFGKSKIKGETSKQVIKAMQSYMATGNEKQVTQAQANIESGIARYFARLVE